MFGNHKIIQECSLSYEFPLRPSELSTERYTYDIRGVTVLSGNGCDRDSGTCHEVFFIQSSNKVRKIHHMNNLLFCPDFYIS